MQPKRYLGALYGRSSPTKHPSPTQVVIDIWRKALKIMGWEGKITKVTPLWDTSALDTLRSKIGTHRWDSIGILTIGDIWREGKVIPWADLKAESQLAPGEFFRYLQVSHAIKAKVPVGTELPETSPLEARLLLDHQSKKDISSTYRTLLNNTPDMLANTRRQWAQDIGDIEDEDWAEAIASPREVGIRTGFRLVQLKSLHHTYYAPSDLAKMGRIHTNLCKRKCGEVGTFYHVVWTCPLISRYWGRIMECVNEVTGTVTDLTPSVYLLNVWGPTDLPRALRIWTTLGMAVPKRNVARLWGAENTPTLL